MRIGMVGLGRMGSAMAARLLESGNTLVVWNRTGGKAKPLLDAGATVAASPRALAEAADVVVTMLFDALALDAVFHGPDGLLAGDLAGKLVIEMSTVRPQVQQELAEAVRGKGGAFVECPVGGTVAPARAGKLIGLAGGDDADVARARPVLEQLCRRLEHVGPVGAGASMKLAINLPLVVFWQALGEAHALVRHLGRDPAWLVDLFGDSAGGANVLKARGDAVAAAFAGGDGGAPAFSVDAIRKDLRTMLEEAAARGFELPVAARALAVFDTASGEGFGERDCTFLPAFWGNRSDTAAAPKLTLPKLTLDVASRIADAALRKGRELALAPLTVAVLDPGGHLVAFKREDGSGILRYDIAFGKAWGSLGMGFGSREMASRAQANASFVGALATASGGRVIPGPGGVLVKSADGATLGAVGISGDLSDKDEACCIAGIEAAGLHPQVGA